MGNFTWLTIPSTRLRPVILKMELPDSAAFVVTVKVVDVAPLDGGVRELSLS